MKLSVIIPAFKEPFLQKTIDDLLAKSELGADIEVIPVLDGPWMDGVLKVDPRVTVIQHTERKGMRGAINSGVDLAIGKYIMKVDAHCAFGQGFDRIMCENYVEDSLMIPRRYSLDEVRWNIQKIDAPIDYHYLLHPSVNGYMTPHVAMWQTSEHDIDDTMTLQGSCWMASRESYDKRIGSLDSTRYGTFAGDQLELGLKYWLGGGSVKVNKKTWYAHLFKMPRHYATGDYAKKAKSNGVGWKWATEHWLENKEPGMMHDIKWLVKKFWPVPTWPAEFVA